jgi:hypothetical protein
MDVFSPRGEQLVNHCYNHLTSYSSYIYSHTFSFSAISRQWLGFWSLCLLLWFWYLCYIYLRGHVVTSYADIGDQGHPFCALILESHDFHFTAFDIVHFRQDLAIFIFVVMLLPPMPTLVIRDILFVH